MRIAILDRTIVRTLIVLAIAQLMGWGSVGLLAIVGSQIAADLQISIAAVFAGNSVFYVVMGLWAPPLAKAFNAFGARKVMIMGTILAAPGFVALAAAHGPVLYFTAWVILGTAGCAMLTTAAYIMLNEVAGSSAKSAIGVLMLMTGLSSSIFWPAAAFLSGLIGWRMTYLVYAAAMIVVCLPLYAFGLPRRPPSPKASSTVPATRKTPAVPAGIFRLIVSAITLNAFVTFGFSAILIELLKAEGLPAGEAVAFGSMLGILQVGARGVDFLGAGRWDGMTTALFAGLALPFAMLLLILGHGTHWSIAGFILLYGLGSGILAVSRATIPLVFYDQAAYARAASNIALPLNLISAISPPLLAGLLAHFGSEAVLGLAMLCSCGAFVALLRLNRRRPARATAGTVT
ncbi:MFS transporter [Mesorhizobium sp. M2A.F.Ca.ET.043.02.1.1]|uniref:MFS transporter n=1 Tax=Mesorhizobium sp. M2A.F.Ca.ET.043.02.1.1 TaxID=2493670 RepID=UPI000F7506D5|nr:MFS transporter [Mesorhizobium sp. M2A.F.Ca.ET.043.02.1.1]AZO01966.1 MFS transporter [Mesorhizobium sp. M2A.F.Ca.ET.043.02.1.1]